MASQIANQREPKRERRLLFYKITLIEKKRETEKLREKKREKLEIP